MNKEITNGSMKKSESASGRWIFNLYIAGNTPHCMLTLDNLTKFCDQYLSERYFIDVIDLVKHPEFAKTAEIIAIPTIIKFKPEPVQYIIGDFSDWKLMLMKLGLDTKVARIRKSKKSEQPTPPFQ